MVSEQARIEGERKEVDVKDYPKAAAIAQVLKDLKFPADKKQIVDWVKRARQQSEEILSDIQKIEGKQYENVSEVQGQQDSSGDNHVGVYIYIYISIYKLVYGLKSTTEWTYLPKITLRKGTCI